LSEANRDDLQTKKLNIWTNPFVVAGVAILCCALWGSAFPAIKLGYQWFDIASCASSTQILLQVVVLPWQGF